ncbi:hypothetical protein [Chitinophaga sp. S165]|uniref:hypothetical protein n=1 Tax=Chitinophaga sp. S165 TaxID=2135462 RepID=UPI0011B71C03|nr:hypothetical protein [Chitinophaga sp. S165]
MKYIVVILCAVLFQSCLSGKWKEKVLNACVNDYQRHSYFISLKVRTDSAVVRCIVRNGNLFLYFNDRQGLNESQYASLAKEIIKEDRVIAVSAADRKRYDFAILYGCEEINQELEKGTEYILGKYFRRWRNWYTFKGAVTNETENGIINALFERHVIVTTGDESGSLMLPDWQFKGNPGAF